MGGRQQLGGKGLLDGGEHFRCVRHGARAEAGRDRAVRPDEELLEVPLDVARLARVV